MVHYPLVFACYFLAIIVFSMAKRKSAPVKGLNLFRALLPSWRFFEDFDEAPVLYYRFGSSPDKLSEWEKCLARPKRRAIGLLFNPEANFVLAAGSLVQQLLNEIEDATDIDSADVEKLSAYRLTHNLVRFHLPVQSGFYQFKISGITEDFLISPTYSRTLGDEAV